MQIQRTGYQQNFGTSTVIGTRNKNLAKALINLGKEISNSPNSRCMIEDLSQEGDGFIRTLLVDDAEKTYLACVKSDAELRPGNKGDFERALRELPEDPNTRHIEVSSLGELLLKRPMLNQFAKQLLGFLAGQS